MYEKKDAERQKILTEVAQWIEAHWLIRKPVDEVEQHANHVVLELARAIRQDRVK